MRIQTQYVNFQPFLFQQLIFAVQYSQGAHIIYQIDMLVMIIEKDQLKYIHRTKS